MDFKAIIGVFVGGGLGALTRYTVYSWIQGRNATEFPWGTFWVNISGAFLIGLLMTVFVDHFKINPHWRYFWVVGILGGYTTFSALSWEAYELYSVGAFILATSYMVSSLVAGLVAAMAGVYLGRLI